jgi:hypothetical protein
VIITIPRIYPSAYPAVPALFGPGEVYGCVKDEPPSDDRGGYYNCRYWGPARIVATTERAREIFARNHWMPGGGFWLDAEEGGCAPADEAIAAQIEALLALTGEEHIDLDTHPLSLCERS